MSSAAVPVKVALRVRPLLPKELEVGNQQCIRFVEDRPQVIIGKDRSFTFDFVFSTESSQEEVFSQCVEPLIDTCFKGYNATVLAYGQTGSGKTFTMGTAYAENANLPPHQLGIIPRVIDKIFAKIEQMKEEGQAKFTVKVSFLELYNEEIRDMFNPETPSKLLQIREDPRGLYIANLTEAEVADQKQLTNVLMVGSMYRTTGSTSMNSESSRSHAIFTIILHEAVSNVTSKFHFVDLAGSERLARTKAEGVQMKEGISINSGLLALGNVINALGDEKRKSKHIPYRDSKLTRILQDSLGGNSRTVMIACASPAQINYDETLNTLKYADRAKQIKNKPVVNLDPVALELANLRKQVMLLKAELQKAKSQPLERVENADDKKLIAQLQAQVKELQADNKKLKDENASLMSKCADLKENNLKLEVERDANIIYKEAQNGNVSVEVKLQEAIEGYLRTIQSLKERLTDTEEELVDKKTIFSGNRVLNESLLNRLNLPQYILESEELQFKMSESTEELLAELQRDVEFDLNDELLNIVMMQPSDSNNDEIDEFGISGSTEHLLNELSKTNFGSV